MFIFYHVYVDIAMY